MDQGQADIDLALRAVGVAFRRQCRGRRVHPTVLRIGMLGGAHAVVPVDRSTDAGLRADLLERVLEGLDGDTAVPWMTRGGALSPGDADFAWFTACATAFGRHGAPLRAFYVITREGWFDLVSDQQARWRPQSA